MFGAKPGDTFGQNLLSVMQKEAGYELTTFVSQYDVGNNAPGYAGDQYYSAFTPAVYNNYGIGGSVRPLAAFAYGTATLIATHTYDAKAAGGISEAQALTQTEMAIRGVAFAHKANSTDSRAFGEGGQQSPSAGNQSAYRSAMAAEAAWMLWDKLTPDTQKAVANMVADEANSFIATDGHNAFTVPYFAQSNNKANYPGDTKAEENAWDGQLMALAATMMPTNPNAGAWQLKASEFQISTAATRADDFSNQMVDGATAASQLHGFNAFSNGVVVNHSLVHPDYMVASVYLQGVSAVNESLAGRYIPQSTVFNLDKVYNGLTAVNFTAGAHDTSLQSGNFLASSGYSTGGTFASPGGTIFARNPDGSYSATIYYPEGNDWGAYMVTDSYLNTDLLAEWLGYDVGKSFDAMGWANARVNAMIALQNRAGHTGNIYVQGDWGSTDLFGADEDFFHSNAAAWLQWWLMQNNQFSPIADHWGAVPVPEPQTLKMCLLGCSLTTLLVISRQRSRWSKARVPRN